MSNIGSKSIHIHYHKLPDETKSHKIENVKLNAFVIISNLAEFFLESFLGFNHSKKNRLEVINRGIKLSKPKELVYT